MGSRAHCSCASSLERLICGYYAEGMADPSVSVTADADLRQDRVEALPVCCSDEIEEALAAGRRRRQRALLHSPSAHGLDALRVCDMIDLLDADSG